MAFLHYPTISRPVGRLMNKSFFHITWLVLLGLSFPGWGQVTSPLGRYEVDYVKGCSPLTVTVTNTSGEINDSYFFDADTCDNSSAKYDAAACALMTPTTSKTFTYTQPGSYSIVQVLALLIPRTDTLTIEVLPPQSPEFNITLCNNYGVAVNITDTHYDQFLIDYGDGSPPTPSITHVYLPGITSYGISVSGYFNNGPVNCGDSTAILTPVNNIPDAALSQVTVTKPGRLDGVIELEFSLRPNVEYLLERSTNGTSGFTDIGPLGGSSQTVSGINTLDNVYCFRIAALDLCSNSRTYSDTICSTNIQVLAQEGQNQLNWITIPINFDRYELTKNNAPLGPPITVDNITDFTDTSVECNVVYCYRTTTVYTNGNRSISAENCVTGINSLPPPAIASLTASVDGNSITLDWTTPGAIDFYRLFRSENNGAFQLIETGNSLPFVDYNLRPQVNRYCYYIIYQNTCGNQSPVSVTSCAILLTGSNIENKNFVLNWTPFTGWEHGINDYQLEIMDENGVLIGPPISLGSTVTSYQDPITQTRQISQYRIAAISNDSIPLRSYSNIVKEDIPLQVFVPNSFTPNNDALNDIFTAKGLFINEYSMEIYSRWGELLYHTTDLEQGWDGVYKGSLVPEDTYVYIIQATDSKGRSLTKNGTVHLLR